MNRTEGHERTKAVENQDGPLRERTSQLDAANQELAAFSYSISHDLRAPLRAISGFSEALAEDYAASLDAEGRDYLQRVRDAAAQMEQFIDALVELANVACVEMRTDTVDVSELANALANEMASSDPARNVRFSIQPGVIVQGDPALLRLCFRHLLENCWKFTSRHSSAVIEFGSEEQNGRRLLYFRDDGAGFDTSRADKLFGAFQRLHPQTEFPGIGMGLAIVRRVVNRHGGRIWAMGEVEQGATLYLELT